MGFANSKCLGIDRPTRAIKHATVETGVVTTVEATGTERGK
jgi:hypothetical protein